MLELGRESLSGIFWFANLNRVKLVASAEELEDATRELHSELGSENRSGRELILTLGDDSKSNSLGDNCTELAAEELALVGELVKPKSQVFNVEVGV
jgi:hypothetical protein